MWILVVAILLLLAAWWSWSARAPYVTPLERKRMAWEWYRAEGGAPAPPLTHDEEQELLQQELTETFSGSTLEPHRLDGSGTYDGQYAYVSDGTFMRGDGLKLYFSGRPGRPADSIRLVDGAGNEKIIPREKLTWTIVK